MFKVEYKLEITPRNKFYKREIDITTVGDSKKVERVDYIFVAGVEKKSGTYFYFNFVDMDNLFIDDTKILKCDKKYIDENFTEISFDDLRYELRSR